MGVGTPAASLAALRIDRAALEGLAPAEREAATAELAALEDAFRENPLLGYRPHPKQVAFHSPPFPRLRAFFGGNRSGKTTAAIVDTLIQLVDRDVVPEHLVAFKRWDAPFKCRVMTPDLTSTLDGVVHEKIREWCPPAQLKGGSFDRAFDKVQRKLSFKNGSWVQFNSSEQDRDKLGGVALHRVVYDEEPRLEARNECRIRLADYNGEEIFALTPFSGMAWLYERVYEPWERGTLDPAKARVVVVDMDDNPYLDAEGRTAALEDYSGPEREARKTGRFVTFSGMIYPQFSEDTHLVPALSRLPVGVEVFRGIDPGWRHMCAVVYCYLDGEDELVVFDEIALKQATVRQVCSEMERRDLRWGAERDDGFVTPLRFSWSVIDPAARNKNPQTGRSEQQEFRDCGVSAIPGQNDWPAGVNRVRQRLEARKLFVAANCHELRAEFRRYRYQKDSGRSEDASRERPVKKDDHCFPAGTLVDTARGRRPIETVRPGDLVWTRQGLFPALLARRTQERAATRVLELEDGRLLRGTSNHPVYVSGKGWTRLDAVRYGDRMLAWLEGAKTSSGTESGSTDIRMPSVLAREPTSSPPPSGCIVPYGSFTTARFHRATKSTTSTRTPRTTTSPTLSASRQDDTAQNATGVLSAASGRETGCATLFARHRSPGIALPTAARGTRSTLVASSKTERRVLMSASTAAASSKALSAATSASAPTAASLRGVAPQGSTTLTLSADGAARPTGRTVIRSPRLVPLRVVGNSRGQSAAVYNLTILGPPEYFANGLLVRNCLDALRYVCMARPLAPVERAAEAGLSSRERWLRKGLERLSRDSRTPPDTGFGPGQWQ